MVYGIIKVKNRVLDMILYAVIPTYVSLFWELNSSYTPHNAHTSQWAYYTSAHFPVNIADSK